MKIVIDIEKLIAAGFVTVVEEDVADGEPKKKAAPRKLAWTARALELWEKKFGVGSASGVGFGRVGRALKRLVEAHGEGAVLKNWEAYLETAEERFCTPESFAARYSYFAQAAQPTKGESLRERLIREAGPTPEGWR